MKADSSSLSIDDLVRMNTDALALLGHVCFEITQRRRESIKPSLHKDYAMLCSSNVPVTSLLFGDDLQTELTHIRATNKKYREFKLATRLPQLYVSSRAPFFRASASAIQSNDDLRKPRQPEAPIPPREETRGPSIEEINTVITQLPSIQVSKYIMFLPRLVEFFQTTSQLIQSGANHSIYSCVEGNHI